MKIGIVIIATGKYTCYLEDLIGSCELNLLPNTSKKYFVFTDQDIESQPNRNKIIKINQDKLGWPFDTLMRFHMMLSIKDYLIQQDYILFMNANMTVSKKVGDEILPGEENGFLMGVHHPGFFLIGHANLPYERNPEISCFVGSEDGDKYFQGCFNGGRAQEWLKMCEVLASMIDKDLQKNLIPVWHDESYLNWYYKKIKPLSLSPLYGYPEQVADMDFMPSQSHSYSELICMDYYILQMDKRKKGGQEFLRK